MSTATTFKRFDSHSTGKRRHQGKQAAKIATDKKVIRQYGVHPRSDRASQPHVKATTQGRPSQRAAPVPQQTPAAKPANKFTIAHAFVIFGYVVGGALFVVFGLDLLLGIPFRRLSILYDVTNVIVGLMLVYLSWNTHNDLG